MVSTENTALALHWPRPAAEWSEAIPVGNGRLGAMVFGGARSARVQINDATIWSGCPSAQTAELARLKGDGAGPARLGKVRAAIDGSDYRTAEKLLKTFQGSYSQEFLPYIDLAMDVSPADGSLGDGYGGRTLELYDGVVDERFSVGTAGVRRQTWASRPASALCIELAADAPLNVRLKLDTPLRLLHTGGDASGLTLQIAVPLDGAPLHEEDTPDLLYAQDDVDGYDPFSAASLSVSTDGESRYDDGALRITGARTILITISSSSNASHWWNDKTADLGRAQRPCRVSEANRLSAAAAAHGTAALLKEHLADVRPLLGATSVQIGKHHRTVDVEDDFFAGDDALKATVLVQFGRYLLVSASRPGGPPANLQGIWNDQLRPAWSSNYTVNINTEMNYWGAETAGLAECHGPLFDLLDSLASHGSEAAHELYGARGWVTHHNTDFWGWSLPVGNGHGDPGWANWMMGGTWLSDHLWQHYEFSLDLQFLRDRAWPLLQGAGLFALDWLIDDGDGGWLRTSPSTSPENKFLGPDGHPESLDDSCASDIALTSKLFSNILAAAAALGEESEFVDQARAALDRLPPPAIAAGGWLQEWGRDHVEEHPQHRHMSQALALFPLGLIDPETMPELAAASAALLDRRGPGAMGWSWAWKIALRARLGHGEAARSLLREASEPFTRDHHQFAPVDGSEWGGLLPNLFSTHPPFQIDGNYGFVGAIIEMLVQSTQDSILLLPALPAAWPNGSVAGVRARGAISIDMDWDEGVMTRLVLHRTAGDGSATIRISHRGTELAVAVPPGTAVELDSGHFSGELQLQSEGPR